MFFIFFQWFFIFFYIFYIFSMVLATFCKQCCKTNGKAYFFSSTSQICYYSNGFGNALEENTDFPQVLTMFSTIRRLFLIGFPTFFQQFFYRNAVLYLFLLCFALVWTSEGYFILVFLWFFKMKGIQQKRSQADPMEFSTEFFDNLTRKSIEKEPCRPNGKLS